MAYETIALSQGQRTASIGVLHSLRSITSTATSTGKYKAFNLQRAYSNFGLQVVTAASSAEVQLQGSLDGTNWDTIAGSSWSQASSTSGDIKFVTGKPVVYIRAYVTVTTTDVLNAYITAGV